jgi:hypothetical protein
MRNNSIGPQAETLTGVQVSCDAQSLKRRIVEREEAGPLLADADHPFRVMRKPSKIDLRSTLKN